MLVLESCEVCSLVEYVQLPSVKPGRWNLSKKVTRCVVKSRETNWNPGRVVKEQQTPMRREAQGGALLFSGVVKRNNEVCVN